ncbi:TRIC cation channel family protein, partial [Klebsiella pneumoniae]
MLVYWLDIIGTAVFAISGVLLAGKLRMDPFGVLVLGVVTAVGGGTIRDMALANGPVFWVKDPTDLVVAMVTSMLTILLVRQPRRLPKWGSKRESQKIPSFRMMKIQSTPRLT